MTHTHPNRRDFLKTSVLAAASASAAPAIHARAQGGAANRKRNVLLYVVDDQGRDDAGCYGNPVIDTPGLDRLAENGVRFNNAYCSSPSCSASRSCILTGMHNHATGQYGHMHSYNHFVSFDNLVSLPKRLGGHGYRTISAGKYHVAPKEVYPFDTFVPGAKTPADLAENCRKHIAADSDQPFFLYFCTTEPHRPFKHQTEDEVDPAAVIVPPYLPDTQACRKELALYYASVRQADRGLERLLDMLDETGHWEDTLVIYISDNGIAFPGAKTCVYEPGVNLPCVVRDPRNTRTGVATGAFSSWADIAPSICDWAGISVEPGAMHGRSFLDVLDDETPTGWDTVYGSHTFHEITMYYPMRWLREDNWKLIWNIAHDLPFPFASDLYASKTWQDVLDQNREMYGPRPVEKYLHRDEFELYDLASDPNEVENLAEHPDHAETVTRLKKKLREFQQNTGDPWELKWRYE
ncbi:MAG: sulfatase [Candidatus Hydrogenedentota bacterium]